MEEGSAATFARISRDAPVGRSLIDIQAEGVDGLYLIGERTSAAKVMGVYGAAQVAIEACDMIVKRLSKVA